MFRVALTGKRKSLRFHLKRLRIRLHHKKKNKKKEKQVGQSRKSTTVRKVTWLVQRFIAIIYIARSFTEYTE